jgi:hypothetical protein
MDADDLQPNPPPDVEQIKRFSGSDQNEVNSHLQKGWVLLAVLVNRQLTEGPGFNDLVSYILGKRRGPDF